ncbi:MAG TPA: DUF3108 domain-containing protein [Pyrinomonadaceae bacterium]|nr:DUF3108 domain-containing protein [Pyrinomonadaceae bacterium]
MKRNSLIFARTSLLLLLLAATGTFAGAQQPGANQPSFFRGEELFYEAEFKRALVRGANIGEFRFSAHSEQTAAGDPLRLVGDAVSKGFFTRIAGVHFHEHVESIVEPDQLMLLRTNKLDEQGKRVRVSDAIFDHEKRKVTWTEHDPNQNQPPRITSLDFQEPIQDILSMIYFLRTKQLDVGKSFEIPVSDSGRVFRMTVAVVERKRIKCVLGRVSAVRVEPAMFGEGRMLRGEGKLSIWITEDRRHLPVWAHLNLNIGTVDIKLKRVSYQGMTGAR